MSHNNQITCPACHRSSQIHKLRILAVSLENWPESLFCAALVAIFAKFMALAATETIMFSALAALPLLFKIRLRYSCHACHVQFSENQYSPELSGRDYL
ncbi:MAG: hypothetical protein KDD42_07370 [Bdellovibrionales bacterium]|nr:hypothetical protein [Bdellovibrionales bacterium]